jgi:hypothetical protein
MSSVAVLLSLLLAGQAPGAVAQSSASALEGVWEGTLTTVQIGKCSMNGGAESSSEVRIVLRPGSGGTIGGVLMPLTVVPPPTNPKDNLSVKIAGDKLRIEHERTALCGETFKRKYTAKLEGSLPAMVDGKRMLVLKGLDVPCIQTGCRFDLVLSAEWKGPPP